MAAGCKCAKTTDEYHGYECEITGGACAFLFPSSKACAKLYGEGPDATDIEEDIDPYEIPPYPYDQEESK